MYNKEFGRSYSPCPNLEGIKEMHSPTSPEDSQLVRIVPCEQTKLPKPRGHRDALSSGASAVHFDRPARQATEPQAKREAMPALCHGLVYNEKYFSDDQFSYSPCPNLEDIKDELSY